MPEWHSQRLARDLDARAEEARGLALAIGLDVVAVHTLRLRQTRAATLLGVGQIDAIAPDIAAKGVQLVVVDAALSPIQQRNLETAFGTKVIDRTGLILEIFGERAATAEGRLQVELAHLDYQAGRLVRSWTHLERQRGGFGFLGGPGETQIEADRRGCLGIKASQEYAGKHEGIAARGEQLGYYVEKQFIGMCGEAGFHEPAALGKQIAILFQGALLLSQVYRNPAPFVSARTAVETLLKNASH